MEGTCGEETYGKWGKMRDREVRGVEMRGRRSERCGN